MKKRVITYGTFDLLHKGHINILKNAAKLGDELYVGLSTDSFNAKKGKRARQSYKKRKQKLEELGFIEKVFPERTWEQKKNDILSNDIDILTMGSDWEGKFNALSKFCEIEITERTYGISSTALRMVNLEINLISNKASDERVVRKLHKKINDCSSYVTFKFWNLKDISIQNIGKLFKDYEKNEPTNYSAFVIYSKNLVNKIYEIVDKFEDLITSSEDLGNSSVEFDAETLINNHWILF